MPRERTAYKELRKARGRHFKNISTMSELRTVAKKFEKLVSEKKAAEAKALADTLISKFDRAAAKGIIHKNAAARRESAVRKQLAALAKT